jgi:thioredoxin-like negative regulator of GroEL
MRVEASSAPQQPPEERNGRTVRMKKPILLFFTKRTSGPARRMESLIAHVARKERRRLRVVSVDADENVELAERLSVEQIPTIVLVDGRSLVGKLEGRATGGQIDELINDTLTQ